MIEEVTNENFKEILPLINEYQQFYGVKEIDDEKNSQFFSQFINNADKGVLFLYRVDDKAIGFGTIYNGFSSTRAEVVAVLNDLYVQPVERGKGYGKALINHAMKMARTNGYSRLQWLTAEDNIEAQKLYNTVNANQSKWLFYAKEL